MAKKNSKTSRSGKKSPKLKRKVLGSAAVPAYETDLLEEIQKAAVKDIQQAEDYAWTVVWGATDLERQQSCIAEVCAEIADMLKAKNRSYDGSAFKDVVYAGTRIPAEETINVRITDKIRRLQSEDPHFNGEDAEKDLLGYLVLKLSLKKIQSLTTTTT